MSYYDQNQFKKDVSVLEFVFPSVRKQRGFFTTSYTKLSDDVVLSGGDVYYKGNFFDPTWVEMDHPVAQMILKFSMMVDEIGYNKSFELLNRIHDHV